MHLGLLVAMTQARVRSAVDTLVLSLCWLPTSSPTKSSLNGPLVGRYNDILVAGNALAPAELNRCCQPRPPVRAGSYLTSVPPGGSPFSYGSLAYIEPYVAACA